MENLAGNMLDDFEGKKEGQKPESSGAGSVEDAVIEGMRMIDEEIRQLAQRVVESKESKAQNLAEFNEELSAAKKERKEWGKLLKLAVGKRAPTFAESAMLKEERLAALVKAAEAAKGAGVENLEEVEAALREADTAFRRSEPRGIGETLSDMQARKAALREKERLLTEARLWLRKATIIQSIMEARTGAER